MEIKQIDLLKLQSEHMKSDPTTIDLCNTLSTAFNNINPQICNIHLSLDYLQESVLDELAIEKNIFWYDSNASIETKVKIIKNAEKVFKYLGTNYAVEQVIEDYFGDGEILEWYDYNGSPYHFKVKTSNLQVTEELAQQFTDAVNKVKRLSTRLEEVVVNFSATVDINYGFALHGKDTITLSQEG